MKKKTKKKKKLYEKKCATSTQRKFHVQIDSTAYYVIVIVLVARVCVCLRMPHDKRAHNATLVSHLPTSNHLHTHSLNHSRAHASIE